MIIKIGAFLNGVVFACSCTLKRWDEIVFLISSRVYHLLHILEFSSSRKRMSVIVRSEENKLLLLCKGPDSIMFEKLSQYGRHFEAETKDHIKRYSEAGLRTLVVAYRELDEEEYKLWDKEFSKANTSLAVDRDALVDDVVDKFERDLILLGATTIEDKLQKGIESWSIN